MLIQCNKIYFLDSSNYQVNKTLNQIGKLSGDHPVIIIPKPQSIFQKNNRIGKTYFAIVGTSHNHRDIEKYLFTKKLKNETFFFSSQIREINEDWIKGEFKSTNNILSHEEYKKCYNIVKDYVLDVENQWLEEFYEELFNYMGENMTEERRQEIWQKIQKQEPIRFTIERLEKSNKELIKSNKRLEESNKELQKENKEFKYLLLKEREENGKILSPKQEQFLTKYEEEYLNNEDDFEM